MDIVDIRLLNVLHDFRGRIKIDNSTVSISSRICMDPDLLSEHASPSLNPKSYPRATSYFS